MKLTRYLLAALTLLATARASQAQDVQWTGLALTPFTAEPQPGDQECPAAKADSETWQNDVVSEGLRAWQVLCKKGRLAEAEQLAQMLASLQPDNPKVRAACTVTQFFKSLADQASAELNAPAAPLWRAPAPVACGTGPCPSTPEMLPMPTCISTCAAPRPCAPPDHLQCTQPQLAPFMAGACWEGTCPGVGMGMILPPPHFLPMAAAGCDAPCCAKGSCCQNETKAAKSCGCGTDGNCCCAKQPAVVHLVVPHLPPAPHVVVMPHAPMPTVAATPAVRMRRIIEAQPTTTCVPQAHLVTPHFEAHCERMSCNNTQDRIILEGDVRLTCKKDGQQYRVEGQRVVVNLQDGTFAVESSAKGPAWQRSTEVRQSIHVVPVPPCPED